MQTRYQLGRDGSESWTKPQPLADTLRLARQRANKVKGPYRIKERGEDHWSNDQGLPKAIGNMRRRLSHGQVGDMVLLRCQADRDKGLELQVRKVHYHKPKKKGHVPPVPQCTPAIADVWRAAFREFDGRIVSWGIFNCRHIAGSSTYSQHAWANAVDFHGTNTTMNAVAHWAMNHRGELHIANVLWQGRNLVSGGSVDDHYDHVHIDCEPTRTGTPPCA